MYLTDLKPARGARKRRKIVGRGHGSGHGHTACRGMKGQNSRSGGGVRPGFEGGQMPLTRRLPKRGFTSRFKESYTIINLDQLEQHFGLDEEINPEVLVQKKLVGSVSGKIKILGRGQITRKFTVKAHAFSSTAKEQIEKAGGKIQIVS